MLHLLHDSSSLSKIQENEEEKSDEKKNFRFNRSVYGVADLWM